MTDQPTYLTIRVDRLTNTPAFLSGLTDSQTSLTIYPYWNLCIVSCLPVHAYYPPSYKDWLTSAFLFCLLIIISNYLSELTDYLSGPTDWPTSCYLRIYIWADCLSVWLTIMPVFLSCIPVWVNYRPTYMPTYLSWLRNISAFLSCLTYQGWLTDWLALTKLTGWGWLTNKYTCLPIRADSDKKKHACLPIWLTILPSYTAYVSELTQKHFCLPFLPYVSRLTNWPMYLSASLGWLLPNLPLGGERGGSVVECRTPEREVRGSRPTAAVLCPWARHFTPRKYSLITQEAMAPSRHDWKIVDWDVKPQHNQPTIGADWPTNIPVYLSGLTRIKKHACLPIWLTILPSYTAYISGLTHQTK